MIGSRSFNAPTSLNDPPRDRAKLLIARQMAVNNGHVWMRIDGDAKRRYLTFAETALAIVERIADKVSWERFGGGEQ